MELSSRKHAVESARKIYESNPVFLDTETTGISDTAEIIEISIVDLQGKVLFDSLVKPQGMIEPEAARIHKITEGMLFSAPKWDKVWIEVEPILAGRLVGIYNREFDLRMMKQSHRRQWLNWTLPNEKFFCVMLLYAQFAGIWDRRRGSYRWHSLDDAGKQCRISLPNQHRALADGLLTRALFEYMVNWRG